MSKPVKVGLNLTLVGTMPDDMTLDELVQLVWNQVRVAAWSIDDVRLEYKGGGRHDAWVSRDEYVPSGDDVKDPVRR